MEFRVLGPLEVRSGGTSLPLGPRKQQCVLAALIVNAGRAVELSELVDELWPHHPPASAAANARGYAASLRRVLAPTEPHTERLARRGSGYVLHVEPEELDLLAFSAAVGAGRDALRQREPKIAAARMGEALAMWRGPMAAGLPRGPLLAARCTAADDERLAAVETLAEIKRDGRWSDQIAVQGAAIRSEDRAGRVHAHRALARTYARTGRLDEALAEYQHALALLEALGNFTGQSMTHAGLAWIYAMQSRRVEAISHGQRAIELSAMVENRAVLANALNVVGWNYATLGEYEKALPYCEQALELGQQLGDQQNVATTWDSLGNIHHGLGDYRRAVSCLQRALELNEDDRYYNAQTLDRLGNAYHAMGDFDSAQRNWQRALKDFEELGHPDAGEVRAKLASA